MPEVSIIVRAKDEATATLKGIGGSLGTLGTAAAALGVAGAAAMGAVAVGMGKLAVDAAPVEGIMAAFEGIAESSGESADAMLAALKEGSYGMIANRDLMSSYNKAAQLVGTTFANQLPDAMQYLSKVSAATGQDMSYMMNSLVVGVGRQSKLWLDNLGITVDLEKAYEDWAVAMGVAKGEMTDDQKKAALMTQVLEKLAENTAAMPDVTELASTKMAEFRASITDLKDSMGMALLPVLKNVVAALSNLAKRAAPLLELFAKIVSDVLSGKGLEETLDKFGEAIWETIATAFGPEVADMVMGFIDNFRAMLPGINDAIAQVLPILQNLAAFFIDLAQTVLPLVQRAFQFIMDHWQIFAVAAAALGVVILAIQAPIVLIIGAIALLAAAWANNWGGIQDKVMMVWEFLRPIFETIVGIFQRLITEVLPALWLAFQEAWIFIQGAVEAAWEIIRPKLEEMWEAVKLFWEEMEPRLKEAWQNVQKAMEPVAKWIKEELVPKLKEIWEWIADKIIPVIGELAAKFLQFTGSAAVKALKETLRTIIDIWDKMAAAIRIVIGVIKDAMDAIQAAIDAWHRFQSVVGEGNIPEGERGPHNYGAGIGAVYGAGGRPAQAVAYGAGGPTTNINVGAVYGLGYLRTAVEEAIAEEARYAT